MHPESGPGGCGPLVAAVSNHRDQAAPEYVHVPGQHGLEVDLPRRQVSIQLESNETTEAPSHHTLYKVSEMYPPFLADERVYYIEGKRRWHRHGFVGGWES